MANTQLVSPNQYYDSIAGDYNRYLSNPRDEMVRTEVAQYFRSAVHGKLIMDFGGGTGLDLPWLIDGGYKVFFCEPSSNMRRLAEERVHAYPDIARPVFLTHTDFREWKTEAPIADKLNGILANFGVLNYVDDLEPLFAAFHSLLDERGVLIVNVLYASRAKLIRKYFRNVLKAWWRNEKVKTGSQYKGVRHETILHSSMDIENGSKAYFDIKFAKDLGDNSDFRLVHLQRK
jgi:SAM-dependent methyltransferase